MTPRRRPDTPSRQAEAATHGPHSRKERLQKVLAAAGIGSRRQCEELIRTGRIEVDRAVVTRLGTTVDPEHQEIRVDGVVLSWSRRAYYAVHKPRGVVTTHRDPAGRPRVIDLVPTTPERLFPVGRLDLYSDGLILLTNDGELANQLTHPRYGVEKTYRVLVAGVPTPERPLEAPAGRPLGGGAGPGPSRPDQEAAAQVYAPGDDAPRGSESGNPPRIGPGGTQGPAPDADRRGPRPAG